MEAGIKIRMRKTVRSAIHPDRILEIGREYHAIANPHGAVAGICESGEILGVKPGEFEFVRCPRWLEEIWKGVTQ